MEKYGLFLTAISRQKRRARLTNLLNYVAINRLGIGTVTIFNLSKNVDLKKEKIIDAVQKLSFAFLLNWNSTRVLIIFLFYITMKHIRRISVLQHLNYCPKKILLRFSCINNYFGYGIYI